MVQEKLLNKQSKYTNFYDAFKSIKEAEWTQDTGKHKRCLSVSAGKKRKKIVSHVGVPLSNIPSLLCWFLLIRWGTFAKPRLIQKPPKIYPKFKGEVVSRLLTHPTNSYLLFTSLHFVEIPTNVWISSLTNPKGQPSCLLLFFYVTDYPPHQYSWKPV